MGRRYARLRHRGAEADGRATFLGRPLACGAGGNFRNFRKRYANRFPEVQAAVRPPRHRYRLALRCLMSLIDNEQYKSL